jgi:hypothetical protein
VDEADEADEAPLAPLVRGEPEATRLVPQERLVHEAAEAMRRELPPLRPGRGVVVGPRPAARRRRPVRRRPTRTASI